MFMGWITCAHTVVCYHCMRRKDLFAVAISALSLSNKNSREPGATSRATAKKSCAKKIVWRYASCYSCYWLDVEKPQCFKIIVFRESIALWCLSFRI